MRVLVVEDDHQIANTIKKGLEIEKYHVVVTYDGLEGFDLATESNFDVIILDWLLPGLSGIDLCVRLREKQIHTPVLMLTAKTQIDDRVKGLNAGADDYLAKPFAFSELLARIRALVRRPQRLIDQILSVGSLRVNSTTREVTYNRKTLNLTYKEFSLLEYMMAHPNQVKSKQQIMDHVWSYDSDILLNTIEATLRHIRQKLEKAGCKKQIIQTIRGFGYKIGNT